MPHRFYEDDSLSTEIYDVRAAELVAGGPMGGDVEFYQALARETGGPVLEVGCGTGRVTIPLASSGHEVVGVDLSAPMLRIAKAKLNTLPRDVASRLTFAEADMRSLNLGRTFALILTPSRVFQFALTTEDQRAALRGMRDHLAPGGRLVLDLFDPLLDRVVPGGDFPPRNGEVVHPATGNRVEWAVTARSQEPERQLIHEEWSAWERGPTGEALRTDVEELTLRWSLRSEMSLLFELEGLDVVAEYGDFLGGPPAYGREQVWVLRRAGDA